MRSRTVMVLAAALLAGGCGGDPVPAGPPAPAYRVVSQTGGAIVAEVDALPAGDGLRGIFEAIRAGVTAEGGYWVRINCATGGTAAADRRLANGRFGVGRRGEAATGLKAGRVEFAVVDGAACP